MAAIKIPQDGQPFPPNASIILIGIRGCGKRSLGLIASAELKWRFVTEDGYFKERTEMTRAQYLRDHGSDQFHRKGVEVCRDMLLKHRTRSVIECGLGSLAKETQALLNQLCASHPVIHITRNLDHIHRLLNVGTPEALLLDQGNAAQRTCSNFEYYNLYDHNSTVYSRPSTDALDRQSPNYSFKLKDAKEDFSAFIRRIGVFSPPQDVNRVGSKPSLALSATPLEHRAYTHSSIVRLSDATNKSFRFEDLERSEDAVLYLVDVFTEEAIAVISKHIASVRRMVKVPIIFELDRVAFANQFCTLPKEALPDMRHRLLLYGLRLGVEFLVIEADDENGRSRQLISSKGPTKIIWSYHDPSPSPRAWLSKARLAKFFEGVCLGCDLVRMTQVALTSSDNSDVREFTRRARSLLDKPPPVIAYNTGCLGKMSMVLNPTLTPVHGVWQQHQCDRSIITARDAVRELFENKTFSPFKYYVIGDGLSQSLAPAMHTAGYQACGLQHSYEVLETRSIDDVWAVGRDHNFGGASISRPFKVTLCEHIKFRSTSAELIGAINTLIPVRTRSDGTMPAFTQQAENFNDGEPPSEWYGDNTDWIGITTCISRNLAPRNVIQSSKSTALVIGAGGMARAATYALLQLDCHAVFIYNRTTSKAEQVAAHFNSWNEHEPNKVHVLSSPNETWPSNLQPPTIIISCIPSPGFAQFGDQGLPAQWFSSPTGGLVLEMAYMPLNTPFLKAVRSLCKQTGQPWTIVDGLEILPEQGIAQFELLTGRKAPRATLRLVAEERFRGHWAGEMLPSLNSPRIKAS